ncbi:hypothetical protein [Nevskia ramosa]|uniref:hypothetical protein n=1 Tax=Nevskia ramosa TaxID=64002 RepID=UPI0023528935|nr:hypothetical protein [Nevskia ramosa]
MSTHWSGWQSLAAVSLLGSVLGLACLFRTDPNAGVPSPEELVPVSGKLAWVQKQKYGTFFGLVGVAGKFDYPSKASGMGIVRDALDHAGNDVVWVLYEPSANDPIFSDQRTHNVWSLSVDGRPVRTYEETVLAWQRDNRFFPWLGAALLGCGLYLGRLSWRLRRSA